MKNFGGGTYADTYRITGLRPSLEGTKVHLIVSNDSSNKFYYTAIDLASGVTVAKMYPIHQADNIYGSKWLETGSAPTFQYSPTDT